MKPRNEWKTMKKCIEKNPKLKDNPNYAGTGRNSYPNAFENTLLMATKKNHVNPKRLNIDEYWCMDGVIETLDGKPIFYYDVEYSTNNLFDEKGKIIFYDIHVPIEKIDYFRTYYKSVYVRGNLKYVLVLRGTAIIDAFDNEQIIYDFNTHIGYRDFIKVYCNQAYKNGHLKSGPTPHWMFLVKELMGLEYYWI